ncbi:MAG: aminotransferase class I/II-fold pyridoxal phosphate-dependent enzyme [Phycisphaerales bacterium]|nr:aminotransferase class I/II-fold pyridoxal phosphate-dependent enzyme [Phycisphaerales bacterium]
MTRVNSRLRPFGATIFAEMTRLALAHNAVNLGQGAPDFDGPEFVKEAAIRAIRDGRGQYARMTGLPELTSAIAERFHKTTAITIAADEQTVVTCGCTEAIVDAMLALLEPGDEVILFEPFYDSYPAAVAMAGGVAKIVTLHAPHFRIEAASLEAAITTKTKVMLVNTPHNPSGHMLDAEERRTIARVANAHDLVVLSDEVYEELFYAQPHQSLAMEDGLVERTVVLSSLGKSFSFTGWKVGWAIGPAPIISAIRAAHQFTTFCAPTPLQVAAAAALRAPETYFTAFRAEYKRRRDLLAEGLRASGLTPIVPEGSYFILADHSKYAFEDDFAFCRFLVEKVGIAAIPPGAFYKNKQHARTLARFAFCKRDETLHAANERLRSLPELAAQRT